MNFCPQEELVPPILLPLKFISFPTLAVSGDFIKMLYVIVLLDPILCCSNEYKSGSDSALRLVILVAVYVPSGAVESRKLVPKAGRLYQPISPIIVPYSARLVRLSSINNPLHSLVVRS